MEAHMSETSYEQDSDCGSDYICEVLEDLHESAFNVSTSWVCNDGISINIGDEVNGVMAKEKFATGIDDAIKWLCAKASELYPDSKFAAKNRPPYVAPYMPSSPEARSAECICPPGKTEDGYNNLTAAKCPEHGFSSIRVIEERLVEVGWYWRPGDRPGIE
jgi:hypothetical protein